MEQITESAVVKRMRGDQGGVATGEPKKKKKPKKNHPAGEGGGRRGEERRERDHFSERSIAGP